jgi:hypothetical protein
MKRFSCCRLPGLDSRLRTSTIHRCTRTPRYFKDKITVYRPLADMRNLSNFTCSEPSPLYYSTGHLKKVQIFKIMKISYWYLDLRRPPIKKWCWKLNFFADQKLAVWKKLAEVQTNIGNCCENRQKSLILAETLFRKCRKIFQKT